MPRPWDVNVVSCKWVYSLKSNPNGSPFFYKARLVAHGFSQAYGLTYTETFSLVAHLISISVLCFVALNHAWSLHELNISNAFLYEEQVYVEQPLGYVAQGESSMVCLLKKTIYGVKQSPCTWLIKLSTLLFAYGFISIVSDRTVMRKRTPLGYVVLAIYVDDIILTSSDTVEIVVTKSYLRQHFVTRNLSPPPYFLGLKIDYYPDHIVVYQRKYSVDLLEERGCSGVNQLHLQRR